MKRNMICISCPRGCHLTVVCDNESVECTVSGNRCPRGEAYARQEMLNPCRVVTAVIRTNRNELLYLPVRTDKPLPKEHIDELLNMLYSMTVQLPVRRGDVIVADVAGTGINVIASEDALFGE